MAPYVAMIYIVIVRDRHSRAITHQIPKSPKESVPVVVIVQVSLVKGGTNYSCKPAFVDLVPGEKE